MQRFALRLLLAAFALVPLNAGATVYHGPNPAIRLNKLELNVAVMLKTIKGRLDPHRDTVLDPRLVRAARYYGAALTEMKFPPTSLIFENFLLYSIQQHGGTDPHPIAMDIDPKQVTAKGLARWFKRFVKPWGPTHFGVGLGQASSNGKTRQRLVLIFVSRQVKMGTLGRIVKAQHSLTLSAKLNPGFIHPRLYIMNPKGRVGRFPMRIKRGKAIFPGVRLRHRGRYLVELMADNRLGPKVLALFPVYVGRELPILPRYPYRGPAEKPWTREQAETRMLQLVNTDRKRHGLRALLPHLGLRKVARIHSNDMKRYRYFGHHSPRHGTLKDRLRRAQIRFRLSRENISMGPSVLQQHYRLMESPSHRLNILDHDVTFAGIGVSVSTLGGVRIYVVTQDFAQLR